MTLYFTKKFRTLDPHPPTVLDQDMATSWKSTPRCPRSSWWRSPRLLSAFAAWPVLTPGLFTPCLPDTWNHETFFHTDQAAFPYLGIGLKIFLITRPWPAFGRQGTLLTLSSEGTWSNDRDFIISLFFRHFWTWKVSRNRRKTNFLEK